MSESSVPHDSNDGQRPIDGDAWLRSQLADVEAGIVPHERTPEGWAAYTRKRYRTVLKVGMACQGLRVFVDLNLDMLEAFLREELRERERSS